MTSWKTCKLSDVTTLLSGFAFKSSDWQEKGVPVLKITNVRDGHVNLRGCSFISKELAGETLNFQAKKGDLLITLTGEIGATGFYSQDFEARLNQRVGKIIPIDPEVINMKFVAYFLESPQTREIMWATAKGVAQANISPKEVLNLIMPFPSIGEQVKIVEILDNHFTHLDSTLSNLKRANQNASQFRKVYIDRFLQSADGIKTNLGSILKFMSGFAFKSSAWQESGVPVVKIMNVKHREVNLESCSYISSILAEESKNYTVKKGDLLFNMTGATLGAFGFYNLEQEARMNQRVGKFISLNPKTIDLNYLAYFLEAASTQRTIQQLAKGAAQPNISPTDILSIEINLPNYMEQNLIVEALDADLSKVSQVDQICKVSQVESKALRRSLLHVALSGQLTKEVSNV
jgi:type I restriction enzyme S subunit